MSGILRPKCLEGWDWSSRDSKNEGSCAGIWTQGVLPFDRVFIQLTSLGAYCVPDTGHSARDIAIIKIGKKPSLKDNTL